MSSTTHRTSFLPLLKLVSIILLVPSLFSFLPYRNIFINHNKCIVGPTASTTTSKGSDDLINDGKRFYGIWISQQSLGKLTKCNLHHPSRMVTNLELYTIDGSWLECDDSFSSVYDNTLQSWCLVSYNHQTEEKQVYCNEQQTQFTTAITSGLYTFRSIIGSSDVQSSISVSCSIDDYRQVSTGKKTEIYPSTSILLLLNIGLAFIYWDKRVDPSTVSKQFQKIVHEMELWRSFTGALAHFETLHLLFNMMTLQALGTMLESRLASIPFLYYNICLIPLTTIFMIGLIKFQIRQTGNEQFAQTSSVGFSGVLFAWSVVSSLESNAVCPIPFATDVCFDTHRFDIGFIQLKFNLGPFVQLLLMQFIMPRASFIGHLSGIICGFLFHWRILPSEIFWSPQVLIPMLLLLHWKFVRGILPLKFSSYYSDEDTIEDSLVEGDDIQSSVKTRETRKRKMLCQWTKRLLLFSFIASSWTFGIYSNMTISNIISYLMFQLSVKGYTNIDQRNRSTNQSIRNQSAVLWRGTIITFVLVLVNDALVVPVWIVARLVVYSHNLLRIDVLGEPLVMLLRWTVHFVGLILACKSLMESGGVEDEPKVFNKVFGKIVGWSMNLFSGQSTISSSSIQSFTPFGGAGIALGTLGTETSRRSRLVQVIENV